MGTKSETWEDVEAFREAVAEERRQRLLRRRVGCVIAWAIVTVVAVGLLTLLVAALLTATLGPPLFWLLLILYEINFLRLLRALSHDFEWPCPRMVPMPFTQEWTVGVSEGKITVTESGEVVWREPRSVGTGLR